MGHDRNTCALCGNDDEETHQCRKCNSWFCEGGYIGSQGYMMHSAHGCIRCCMYCEDEKCTNCMKWFTTTVGLGDDICKECFGRFLSERVNIAITPETKLVSTFAFIGYQF